MTSLVSLHGLSTATRASAIGGVILAFIGAPAWAGGSTFQDNIAAYRADSRPVDNAPFNSGFVTNLAISQAKTMTGKGLNSIGQNTGSGVTSVIRDGAVDVNGVAATNGGLSIASPIITGTVRGNVTVVVQKGAIKGNITAISPN
ncbi:MAG: hypothetical protein Q7U28_10340 [Aquabacterium sp.]|nr:hypothetical protein [Aquabacterium sp.]